MATTIDDIVHALDAAAGDFGDADPQHTQKITDAIGMLADYYLHTDAATGEYRFGAWSDPSVIVYADVPGMVRPLVEFLERLTERIMDTDWPASEGASLAHWVDRLAHYSAVLGEELQAGEWVRSPRLYELVSAPLISGVYPAGWESVGIFARYGVPDAATPAIIANAIAVHNDSVSWIQEWVASWGEDAANLGEGLRQGAIDLGEALRDAAEDAAEVIDENVIEPVREGAGTILKLVGGAVAIGLVGFVGWKAWQNRSSKKS